MTTARSIMAEVSPKLAELSADVLFGGRVGTSRPVET